MSKPIALILNDTSNAYHWGCYGTSTEIRLSLEDAGYRVERFGVADVHGLKSPPRTDAHTRDLGFRRIFLSDNPVLAEALDAADLVIVNGEGTLHGLRQAAMNLLYVTHLAKTEFQKTVHLINTSLFPCSGQASDAAVGAFYREMLAPVDRIVIREPLSLRQATDIGLAAEPGFDCLPRYLKRQGVTQRETNDPAVVLGGGLGLEPGLFAAVLADVGAVSPSTPLIYVTGAKDHAAQDDANILDVLTASGADVEHRVVTSFAEWCGLLADAACLISGRFHHTIAATFLGTPAVTFSGGTPKINGLCEAFGFPAPLDGTDPKALQVALARYQDALTGEAPQLDDTRRANLLTLSASNFAGL